MWYLIILIWVVAVIVAYWSYKKRLDQRREAHARKFETLLSQVKTAPLRKNGDVSAAVESQDQPFKPVVATVPGATPPVTKAQVRANGGNAHGVSDSTVIAQSGGARLPAFGKKARLMAQADSLLYFVFRTGLPDHEIFANLTLADVVEVTPGMNDYIRAQTVRGLAKLRLDLVVCTRQLEVIAVVLVDRGNEAAHTGFAAECLRSAGIRLVQVNPAAPPRHQQVRGLVYGGQNAET
jgi:Protein of unknown function (DUF2726)